MSINFKTLIPILAMLVALSGCGDLLGRKVIKRDLGGSQFEVNCELDMNKFSKIMTQNINSQIRCLGENLNLFIRIVDSGKPGYLSRVQLENYLRDFRPDVQPEVIKVLGTVFNIGHLITGEDSKYISKATIDKVITFATIFNQQAALNFGPIFQNEATVSYELHQNHRHRVSVANLAIIQALRDIFQNDRNGDVHSLDIVDLLESFSTDENRHEIRKFEKILFLKKVLLGGEKDKITHLELEKLILNFDHLLLIALDAIRYKYISLNQASILQLLKRDVGDLFDILTRISHGTTWDTDTLFTIDEAIEGVNIFVDDPDFRIEDYKVLIGEFKSIFMTGNTTDVKGLEIKELFKEGKDILQTGTVFHRIYDKFKVQLSAPGPVNIDFSDYRHTYPEHQKELDQFERIVKKYRFMKGEFLSAYYSEKYWRNPDGVFEIALFEYALRQLFIRYGQPSPNTDSVGGYSINKDEMQALVLKFEDSLIDMGLLLPQGALRTADNISLLGSLFQYQSDKNGVMDVNEATEFGASLFTSMNISDDIYSYLATEKNCSQDEFERLEPKCVRKNFWQGFCTNYRSYYPLLFQYLNAPKKCEEWVNTPESDVFLSKAIEAARTCSVYSNGEEIYYSKGDFMTILLAIIHAETTVLRWDINNNNIMDANEVMNAYEIYSPALDGFLEGKSPIIKRFKKQIFQFMIKYEQVPDEKEFSSIWKFIRFLVSFNKKAPATRKTITAILVAIGEQNQKLQTGPQFDCNLLRDPDNIPRDPLPAYKTMEIDNRKDFSSALKPYLYLAD